MLRDVRYAVIVAAMTTALYTFALSLSPLSFDFGTRAWDMVVLLGIMWMALGFLTGLLCSRFDGRIDDCAAETEAGGGEIDEHAVAKARRLATCPREPMPELKSGPKSYPSDGCGRPDTLIGTSPAGEPSTEYQACSLSKAPGGDPKGLVQGSRSAAARAIFWARSLAAEPSHCRL